MTPEIETTSVSQQTTGSEVDNSSYIEAIKEMKNNYVPREKLTKLESENKQLLEALVNGKEIEVAKPEVKVDVNELRNKLFNTDAQLSDLEYVSTALQLREALLEQGEADPFLPYGDKVQLTAEHYDKAEAVAEVFKECIEFAEGDSRLFTAELLRRTTDNMPYRRK
jgi:hypothetical protein